MYTSLFFKNVQGHIWLGGGKNKTLGDLLCVDSRPKIIFISWGMCDD